MGNADSRAEDDVNQPALNSPSESPKKIKEKKPGKSKLPKLETTGSGRMLEEAVGTNDDHAANNGDYVGPFNEKGEREGQGTMKYSNGDEYSGFWAKDRKHGEGTMKYHNGDVYTGGWQKGKKHGTGTYRYSR